MIRCIMMGAVLSCASRRVSNLSTIIIITLMCTMIIQPAVHDQHLQSCQVLLAPVLLGRAQQCHHLLMPLCKAITGETGQ